MMVTIEGNARDGLQRKVALNSKPLLSQILLFCFSELGFLHNNSYLEELLRLTHHLHTANGQETNALITITSTFVEGAGHVMETLGPTGAYSGASGSDNTFPLSSDPTHPHAEGHRSYEFVPGPVALPSSTGPTQTREMPPICVCPPGLGTHGHSFGQRR